MGSSQRALVVTQAKKILKVLTEAGGFKGERWASTNPRPSELRRGKHVPGKGER